MVRCLELFSGTHSVGKCCAELGIDVVSVDLEMDADFKCDVMDFDYKQFPKDHFDIVWASPPCTYYSRLQTCWKGRRKKDGILVTDETIEANRLESDRLVRKTLAIIDYFSPPMWFLENPLSCLKDRDVMKGRFCHIVDYCKYSDWGYQKRTCIWTNKEDWTALTCKKDCENMIVIPTDGACRHDGKKQPLKCATRTLHSNMLCKSESLRALRKHKVVCDGGYDKRKQHQKTATGGSTKINGEWVGKGTNKLDRYRVPPNLIYSLLLD